MKPTLDNLVKGLIGKTAQADHPITCCNPEPHFAVTEAKIEHGTVFLRGDNTMWFGETLLAVFDT